MLQQDQVDDYVIATGESHSVREFLEIAFDHLGLDPYKHLEEDEVLYRPSEVFALTGDASKAREKLGWENNCSFEALVREMAERDLRLFSKHHATSPPEPIQCEKVLQTR
jgi:GDPmannose 4,6-dehydratase